MKTASDHIVVMKALKFELIQSLVDHEFWYDLENKKLLEYRLDNQPKSIQATYTTGRTFQSQVLNAIEHEASTEMSSKWRLGENAFTALDQSNPFIFQSPGTIYNANTIEEFNNYDKKSILRRIGTETIYENQIKNGHWLMKPNELTHFLLLTYADLKQHAFYYWFAFPSLSFADLEIEFEGASKLDENLQCHLQQAMDEYRSLSHKSQHGFFFIVVQDDQQVRVRPLADWKQVLDAENCQVYLSFADPSALKEYPSWILRNYLMAASKTFGRKQFQVLCYREDPSRHDISSSIILNQVTLKYHEATATNGGVDKQEVSVIGWEKNLKGKLGPRFTNMGSAMDPIKLAESSVTLNLQLMKWRMFPSLDLDMLSQVRCLLIGSGTLGCHVARNLMAWGIFNVTFVDRTRVSFSNPVRQPLYEYEDCLNGGKDKAQCAADHLKKIYPKVNANAVSLDIPMPGHFVTDREKTMENVQKLEELIEAHDAVFLLTDTRESRWLPSLIAIQKKKIVINSALGFESYLIMRYGVRPEDENAPENHQRLGCYFCNDVVAPVNSMKDRTLDQQCTVTRPGVSAIAGSLAVELLVSLLHHPEQKYATAYNPQQQQSQQPQHDLGIVPHQIRGSISTYQTNLLYGASYAQCTCCSSKVLDEYEGSGFSFLERVFSEPKYLEELTGLKELHERTMKMFENMSLDDDEDDEEPIVKSEEKQDGEATTTTTTSSNSSNDDDFELL